MDRPQLRLREEEESRDLSSCGVGSEEEGTKKQKRKEGGRGEGKVSFPSSRIKPRSRNTPERRASKVLFFLRSSPRKEGRRETDRCTTYRYGSC